MRQQKSKRRRAAGVCSTIGAILLILVIGLCAPLTLPRMLGYHIYNVISGSMEPKIPTGSLVYVSEEEPKDLKKGDVIAFYGADNTGSIITHRVTDNQVVSGRIITKGDANEAEDMNPVEYDRVVGKVTLSIPVLGSILAAVATGYGKIAAACGIGAAVVLQVIAGRLKGDRH